MKPVSAPWGESVLQGTPLVSLIVLSGCAGFLCSGYDQGVANALTASPDFFNTFPLMTNANVQGTVLGIFVVGAFFGCLVNVAIGNRIGRRPLLFASALLTVFGTGLQSGARNFATFIAARIINGFAVGVLTSIVPPYMGEVSKAEVRGILISLELVAGSGGLMISFWVAFGFRNDTGPTGWRVPLAIQGLFVLITLICLPFTPESPRWLMEVGRVDEARAVLCRLHGADYAERAAVEIQEAIALERRTAVQSWKAVLEPNDQCFRYRTILAVAANSFQQFTGINMASYYAGTIFEQAIRMPVDQAQLALGGLGIASHVSCILGCFGMIERIGRVRTMMIGGTLNTIAMIFLAAGIAHIEVPAAGYVAAVGLYLFVVSFSATFLPCGWLYGAEVTPLAIRLKASALGNAFQYIFNFMVVQVTPVGIANIGYKYYIPFAISNAVMVPLLYFFFPEISQLSLEEVDELFSDGVVRMRRSPRQTIGHEYLAGVERVDDSLSASEKEKGADGSGYA